MTTTSNTADATTAYVAEIRRRIEAFKEVRRYRDSILKGQDFYTQVRRVDASNAEATRVDELTQEIREKLASDRWAVLPAEARERCSDPSASFIRTIADAAIFRALLVPPAEERENPNYRLPGGVAGVEPKAPDDEAAEAPEANESPGAVETATAQLRILLPTEARKSLHAPGAELKRGMQPIAEALDPFADDLKLTVLPYKDIGIYVPAIILAEQIQSAARAVGEVLPDATTYFDEWDDQQKYWGDTYRALQRVR